MQTQQTSSMRVTDEFKILTLICFILSEHVNFSDDEVAAVMTYRSLVSYFTVLSALNDAKTAGYVLSEGGVLLLSEKGRDIAERFAESLPKIISSQISDEAYKVQKRLELHEYIRWNIRPEPENGGFRLCARLLDMRGGADFLTFSVFCKDRDEIERIESRFARDPNKTFTKLMTELTEG